MTQKKHRLLLGAHMSIAGGLEKAIERGESIGCTTMQIFIKSNRQWKAKPLTQQEIDLFKHTAKKSTISPIVAHATYLINLAAANKQVEKNSIDCLTLELERCNELEIPYLILHPGAYAGPAQEGLDQIARNLDHVLSSVHGNTMIALETMAGQGTTLGNSFEQLAYILESCKYSNKIGICFDTCHAFVAGYDFRSPDAYEKMWHLFDTIIGLKKLKALHINDSKKECASKVDRHEHIGKGKLGLHPFELLFNDERFFDIPKILETPKEAEDPLVDDQKNMKTIYSLLSNKTKKTLGID